MVNKFFMFCVGILILSCKPNEKQLENKNSTQSDNKTNNFEWLVGKWKRLEEKEGKETFEHWNKVNSTEYSGIGFTMQNNDTIWQEQLSLVLDGVAWNLLIKSPEDKNHTIFKITGVSESEFICENKSNDFPKEIKYWRENDLLKASVSNEEMKIRFEFEMLSERSY